MERPTDDSSDILDLLFDDSGILQENVVMENGYYYFEKDLDLDLVYLIMILDYSSSCRSLVVVKY